MGKEKELEVSSKDQMKTKLENKNTRLCNLKTSLVIFKSVRINKVDG